jgi:nucleoid-associated protein YgaU
MRASIVRGARGRGQAASLAHAETERGEEGIDALVDALSRCAIRDAVIETAQGKLVVRGTATYQLDRERLFDAIKQLDRWESDVLVDVSVERSDARGYHTVQVGETLSSIAEQFLGDASRDMAIFDANRDRMNDPDQILPGQQLLIPWR